MAEGTIRNPDGTKARSDKKLSTLRKEYALMQSLAVQAMVPKSEYELAKKAVEKVRANRNVNVKHAKR